MDFAFAFQFCFCFYLCCSPFFLFIIKNHFSFSLILLGWICAFLPRSDRPIAIAYSPTEPNPSHLADVYRPTPAHSASPVFVNAANDESVNANQQFEAPFIPSINLENIQSTHNGWLIVTPPSVPSGSHTESKSNRISASLVNSNSNSNSSVTSISRSDSNEAVESETSVEGTTKKFDFDSFKPELQGGFMPIYKSGIAQPAVTAAPAVQSRESENNETEKPKSEEKSEKSDRSDVSLESLIYDDDEI